MRKADRAAAIASVVAACALGAPAAFAQAPAAGYRTRMILEGPTVPGPDQIITGSGAPPGPGVFVELWRVPAGGSRAESIASAEVALDGRFRFEHIDVLEGEHYHVTLSRCWHFDRDGDTEGWSGDASKDTMFEVSGGTLKISMRDGNGDGLRDPYMTKFFSYNPDVHRVIEIRFRHLTSHSPNVFAVFWGAPWLQRISYHKAETPSSMADFETMLIPMNVDENQVTPAPDNGVDGLWVDAPMNDALRIDPLNNVPFGDDSFDGLVFEIDYIRIREDFRLEFNTDGDFMSIGVLEDFDQAEVIDGSLRYHSLGQPSMVCDLFTGRIESPYFERFCLGLDTTGLSTTAAGEIAVHFNDADSGDTYIDDGGTEQLAAGAVSLRGRQDVSELLDVMTDPNGEWTEDGGVSVQGLRFDMPGLSSPAEELRIDYMGFAPASPYGPSNVMPNNPPVAVIAPDPDPPRVELAEGSATVTLDGSASDDGDGGAQGLTFLWSKVSGPAGDAIAAPEDDRTAVSFTQAGEYLYSLEVDDGNKIANTATAEIVITVTEPPPPPPPPDNEGVLFLRGDVNCNGRTLEIADTMLVLRYLFHSRPRHPGGTRFKIDCADTADVDDSGSINVRDPVLMLRYFFGVKPLPEGVFDACDYDFTPDGLPPCWFPEDVCSAGTRIAQKGYRKHDLPTKWDEKRERKRRKRDFRDLRKNLGKRRWDDDDDGDDGDDGDDRDDGRDRDGDGAGRDHDRGGKHGRGGGRGRHRGRHRGR